VTSTGTYLKDNKSHNSLIPQTDDYQLNNGCERKTYTNKQIMKMDKEIEKERMDSFGIFFMI
jgi:hypothetical protein